MLMDLMHYINALQLSTVVNAGRHPAGLEQSQQRQEQRTPCPFSLLPNDLLGHVFPAPDVKGARRDPNRLSVRAACRWLRDAFDSCNTHLTLVGAAEAGAKGKTQRRSHHALLQRLITRTSSLSSLCITAWTKSRELLKLSVPWGQLRVLDLSGLLPCRNDLYSASGKPKPLAFRPLARCSALEELAIFGNCLFKGKPDMLPFCSTLRSLRLLDTSKNELCGIAPLFPALQQLVLEGGEDDKLDLANVATCTGLRQLHFRPWDFFHMNDSYDSMSSLTGLTQLTKLSMECCHFEYMDDLQHHIAMLSSLRHLELQDADCITDISPLGSLGSTLECLIITGSLSMVTSSLGPCLSSCTLLRHLDLSGYYEDEEDALDLSALSACLLLEHLDLRGCPVTGSLEAILPCTRLQRLLLSRDAYDDFPLQRRWVLDPALALVLPLVLAPLTSLVELDLSFYEDLRDLSPLTACISLSTLNISHCPRVKSLAPLAACKQLQVLRLSGCVRVTSLEPLAACTKLKRLDLNGCKWIKSLVPLLSCNVLERLHLGGCNSLASLGPLVACTALRSLNLSNFDGPIDLAPLAACPSLQHLSLYRCCSSMDITPLRSCSHLKQLTVANPLLYLAALSSLTHLKNLTITN